MNQEFPKDYIGDGVYALYDGLGIWLHANDHENPTDRVYLEPEVLESLNRFNERCELWRAARENQVPQVSIN